MSDCIFCSIISGDIPSSDVYEDDHVVAFNDINPKARVHVLVVPKVHFDKLHESDESHVDMLGRVLVAVGKVAAITDVTGLGISSSDPSGCRCWAGGFPPACACVGQVTVVWRRLHS